MAYGDKNTMTYLLPGTHDGELLDETRLRNAIVALFDGFSIEVTPREVQHAHIFQICLKTGTSVHVTWLRDLEFADTVRACTVLREHGMNPVPHVAVRAIGSRRQLETLLTRLRDEAGVQQILLIGGDFKTPIGPFDCTPQVLETGLLQDFGIRRIGVAGHPEGSPNIGEPALKAALNAKNAFAQATGAALYIVTQFFFDAAPVITWEREIRNHGNRLPIHVGLHGLVSIATLIKYAKSCGIGRSINSLMRQQRLLKLASAKVPDRLVLELACAKLADCGSGIEKCHLFPFGSVEPTARWATALSMGDFRLVEGPTGLEILSQLS